MRRDRILLRGGYGVSVGLAVLTYLTGFGLVSSLGVLVFAFLLTRSAIFVYYERFLAFKTFEEFKAGRIQHECIACGASCHLRVNLGKDDVERILNYAMERGIEDTIIEKSRKRYWLKRNRGGACVFLTYSEGLPRCKIYSIRPIACRLYPLIPTGNRLKADPMCPGFGKSRGHTFKEHLTTQEVGPYLRKAMGKV
jgi:Fe-S-cluster containining protein